MKIKSSVDNISEITVTFLGKISGLDDIENMYTFEDLNKNNFKPLGFHGFSFVRFRQ